MMSVVQAIVISMLFIKSSLPDEISDMAELPYVNVVYLCRALEHGMLLHTCVQEDALYREVINSSLWSRSLVKDRRSCTDGLSLPSIRYKDVYQCLSDAIINRSKIRLRRWRDDEDEKAKAANP